MIDAVSVTDGLRLLFVFIFESPFASLRLRERMAAFGYHAQVACRASVCRRFLLGLLACAGGCSGFDVVNALTPAGGVTRLSDIPYGRLPRQRLDVYLPDHRPPETRPLTRGVIVFFYGGGWVNGRKADYRFVGRTLARRGYTVVLPDYRLAPAVRFPAFVEDAAAAVTWAHAHRDELVGRWPPVTTPADEPRPPLFLVGHSAGAHLALLVTLDPAYLRALGLPRGIIAGTVGVSGPYRYVPAGEDAGLLTLDPGPAARSAAARRFAPLFVARDLPPTLLLLHGTADRTVPADEALALADALRDAGASVEVRLYPRTGHITPALSLAEPFKHLTPTLRDVQAFTRSEVVTEHVESKRHQDEERTEVDPDRK